MGSIGPRPAVNGSASINGHATMNGSTSFNGHSALNGSETLNGNSSTAHHEAQLEPIAVVGMSCRLPGSASNTQKLWDLLTQGRSAWSPTPKDRFNQQGFHDTQSSSAGDIKPGTVRYAVHFPPCLLLSRESRCQDHIPTLADIINIRHTNTDNKLDEH